MLNKKIPSAGKCAGGSKSRAIDNDCMKFNTGKGICQVANRSKGERKMVGIRMPTILLRKAKEEAQKKGFGLNDYYVMVFQKGLELDRESDHAPVQSVQRIA